MLSQYNYNYGSGFRNCWQLVKLYLVFGFINLIFFPTVSELVEKLEKYDGIGWFF